MDKRVLLFIFVMIAPKLAALDYGFMAKNSGQPITRLALFSERCSGSNYIQNLLLSNFKGLRYDTSCHKHFPPWLGQSSKYGNLHHPFIDTSDDCLIVVIFRNPYDWARSMHLKPWHASKSLTNIPFSQFIRSTWLLEMHDREVIQLKTRYPWIDLDPDTGSPFPNILELRTSKIKTMLQIQSRVKNVYYINYETARDHPQSVLEEIKAIFNLKSTPSYQPVIYHKGYKQHGRYVEKKYDPISLDDLIHINAHLDKKLERKIGYRLVNRPENID